MASASRLRTAALALLPVALLLSHRNLTAVAVLIALTVAGSWQSVRVPGWTWPALALAGYLALSSAWTPSTGDRDWAVRIPAFVAVILGVVWAGRRGGGRDVRAFGLAVFAACLLLGVEGATGGGIRDALPPPNAADRDDVSTARGIGLAVAMLPAGGLCLWRSFGRAGLWMTGAAAACLWIGAVRFDVAANVLALAAAAGAGGLAWLAPRRAAVAALWGMAAAFALVPILALFLPPVEVLTSYTDGSVSWRQRLVIWRTVADVGTANVWTALFGAGQQASVALGEAAGTVVLPGSPVPLPRVPTHPHSVFLTIWYEAGALGSALAAASLGLGARRLARVALAPSALAALTATLGSAFVFLAVDASLWTLWRGAALVLAAYGLVLAAGEGLSGVHASSTKARDEAAKGRLA